jgi:dihydrofolate synthase/folylpolyglutamate synthase
MSLGPLSQNDRVRRQAALDFLNRRIDYERMVSIAHYTRQFKLENMRELLRRLGNPDRGLHVVHVAGTKGKGSTSAMVASVLQAAGYRIGLFTSPHLERVEERMAVAGLACSPVEFVELFQRVRPAIDAMDAEAAATGPSAIGPTYFEITTAMALAHFAGRQVDLAVLEAGLGGRLDSTNVCIPAVSVITSISLDHTQQLGNTLEAIAREKAGIVKPGVPVVSGVAQPGPRDVIREVCRDRGARLVEWGREFSATYRPPRHLEADPENASVSATVDLRYRDDQIAWDYPNVRLGLLGAHQATNAAVALAALAQLQRGGWNVSEAALREGLDSLRWPARVELVARRPAVVIDAAHNVASMEALVKTLDESFSPRRRILIFATTQEKDVAGMLAILLPAFDEVLLTRYEDNPRAVPVEALAALTAGASSKPHVVCPTPREAWDRARDLAEPDDLICITGSFFIATQMRREIDARPIRPAAQPES